MTVWREVFSNKEAQLGIAKRNRKINDQLTSQSEGKSHTILHYLRVFEFECTQIDRFSASSMSLDALRDASQKLKGKAATVAEVMKAVAEFNDNMLVMAGIFENYLQMRVNDPTFTKAQVASEWLSYGKTLLMKVYMYSDSVTVSCMSCSCR